MSQSEEVVRSSKGPTLKLHNDEILSDVAEETIPVTNWSWSVETSAAGKKMLSVRYYPRALSQPVIRENFVVWHGGSATYMAMKRLAAIAARVNGTISGIDNGIAELQAWPCPKEISFRRNGKYFDVTRRAW